MLKLISATNKFTVYCISLARLRICDPWLRSLIGECSSYDGIWWAGMDLS